MQRIFIILMAAVCLHAHADVNEDMIKNLEARIRSLPDERGSLIQSYPTHSQSYIYDQALAIIAFTKSGDKKRARELLQGLKSLQLDDGALYFSYYMNGKSPYPEEGDRRIAGAIAWVALAASHYQKEFDDTEYVSFNKKILNYLRTQTREVVSEGKFVRAVAFSATDLEATSWNETEIAALEHNIDAFAAYRSFGKLNADKSFSEEAESLLPFIMNLWDESRSHFWSGINLKSGAINRTEYYLDNQSWTLLALNPPDLKKISPRKALQMNCKSLFVEHAGVKGFMDSKPANRPSPFTFVWSEGSAGQLLAMRRIESTEESPLKCENISSESLLENIKLMKQKDGGIAYATSSENKDFTTDSSVAGTTWFYFASKEINPFRLP